MREYYGFGLYLSSFLVVTLYILNLPSFFLMALPFFLTSLIPFIIIINLCYALIVNGNGNGIGIGNGYTTTTTARTDSTEFLTFQNSLKIMNPNSIPDLQDIPESIVNKCLVMS